MGGSPRSPRLGVKPRIEMRSRHQSSWPNQPIPAEYRKNFLKTLQL
jgi:hypothetical protein